MKPKKNPYLWRVKYAFLAIKDCQESDHSPLLVISAGVNKQLTTTRRESLHNPLPTELDRGDIVFTADGEMYIFVAGVVVDWPCMEKAYVSSDANVQVMKDKGLAWGVNALLWREADEYVVAVRVLKHTCQMLYSLFTYVLEYCFHYHYHHVCMCLRMQDPHTLRDVTTYQKPIAQDIKSTLLSVWNASSFHIIGMLMCSLQVSAGST